MIQRREKRFYPSSFLKKSKVLLVELLIHKQNWFISRYLKLNQAKRETKRVNLTCIIFVFFYPQSTNSSFQIGTGKIQMIMIDRMIRSWLAVKGRELEFTKYVCYECSFDIILFSE